MSRQDRGFTPNLEKLCQSLDDELQKLLDDLKEYLYKDKKLVNDKLYVYDYDEDLDQVYIDRNEIEEYLRDSSDRYIQRYCSMVIGVKVW